VLYESTVVFFFFSSRRRHTRCLSDWSSDRVLFRSTGNAKAPWSPALAASCCRDEGFQRQQLAAKAGLHGAFAFPVLAGNVTLAEIGRPSRRARVHSCGGASAGARQTRQARHASCLR